MKPKSLSKDGGTITPSNDHTVHWATAHLRQRPSSRWTKGQSCTNFQFGPLKRGCSGALPGHHRYNHRMFGHFMQDNLSAQERGIFMAGDGVSWIPAWVEGAVQTSLNAVAGIVRHLSGTFPRENPSPVDAYPELGLKNHRLNKYGRHRVHYKRKKFDTGCPFSSKPRQNGIQEVDPNALYNLFQDPGAAELRETLQGYISNPLDHAIRNQTPVGTA